MTSSDFCSIIVVDDEEENSKGNQSISFSFEEKHSFTTV